MTFTFSGMPPQGYAILPPGRYVLGDPFRVCTEGTWEMIQKKGIGFYVSTHEAQSDWKHMYVVPTCGGSGFYALNDGRIVETESGILGILDAALCHDAPWFISDVPLHVTWGANVLAIIQIHSETVRTTLVQMELPRSDWDTDSSE